MPVAWYITSNNSETYAIYSHQKNMFIHNLKMFVKNIMTTYSFKSLFLVKLHYPTNSLYFSNIISPEYGKRLDLLP